MMSRVNALHDTGLLKSVSYFSELDEAALDLVAQ
jgi:hypothetical protein